MEQVASSDWLERLIERGRMESWAAEGELLHHRRAKGLGPLLSRSGLMLLCPSIASLAKGQASVLHPLIDVLDLPW